MQTARGASLTASQTAPVSKGQFWTGWGIGGMVAPLNRGSIALIERVHTIEVMHATEAGTAAEGGTRLGFEIASTTLAYDAPAGLTVGLIIRIQHQIDGAGRERLHGPDYKITLHCM